MTITDPVTRTGARTIVALLVAAYICCSLTVLTCDVQAASAGDYKVNPTSAYSNQTVQFSVEFTNTGDKAFAVIKAVYEVDWGNSTTTATLTGATTVAKGKTANLTGSFITPDVPPGTYEGNISITVLESAIVTTVLEREANFTIDEVRPLVASITALPQGGAVPLDVTFTSAVDGGVGPYTYAWSAGDGATGEATTFEHEYGAAGRYNATLVVTDSRGSTASASTTVDVGVTKLMASIKATVTSGLAPLSTTLTATVSGGVGPYTCTWTTGDGGTFEGESFTYEYHEPGTYTVRLQVTDGADSSARDLITIVVLSQSSNVVDPVGGTPLELGPMLIGYIFVFAVASAAVVGFMIYRNRTRFRR